MRPLLAKKTRSPGSSSDLQAVAEVLVDVVDKAGAVELSGTLSAADVAAAHIIQSEIRNALAEVALGLHRVLFPVGVEGNQPIQNLHALLHGDLPGGLKVARLVGLDDLQAEQRLNRLRGVGQHLVAVGEVTQIHRDVIDIGIADSGQQHGAGSKEVLTADTLHGLVDTGASSGNQIQVVGIQNIGVPGIQKHSILCAQLFVGNTGDGAVALHDKLRHTQAGQRRFRGNRLLQRRDLLLGGSGLQPGPALSLLGGSKLCGADSRDGAYRNGSGTGQSQQSLC